MARLRPVTGILVHFAAPGRFNQFLPSSVESCISFMIYRTCYTVQFEFLKSSTGFLWIFEASLSACGLFRNHVFAKQPFLGDAIVQLAGPQMARKSLHFLDKPVPYIH